ncbi:HWE histidine kinase domain-containing protein [Methylobacterium soli]|uniref:histidine kinase n=1 Tax=Methylobacterium soli TaxID=553447 RepID=A0A6L3SSW1_9HYPH|nr:HWE histidine kinase domain-containing protein [Methylobacterium soli]KAB1076649.1 GAF domain-containing protein [Methylobacterium soli]GJE45609.1 hypothetical protein AEGHOMDF_4809 [Methylobacterium soli]
MTPIIPSTRKPPAPPNDHADCEREPIHLPGSIQPHGALLVLDPARLTVLGAAGDAPGLLGYPAASLLGHSLTALFGPRRVKVLKALRDQGDLATPVHALDPDLRLGPVPADASLHRARILGAPSGRSRSGRDGLVLEFEAADPPGAAARDPLATVQEMLAAVQAAPDLTAFCQAGAEALRRLSGYDRVMIYRFLPDGAGRVLAESHRARLEPYLGLHYPASDIPQQARALYLRNWLRVIADVDDAPAPLLAGAGRGRPPGTLDMSQCILRAVAPIHLQYLRNMGVAATMTISIIVGGQLWGLIACHHTTPKRIPRPLRAICELFGHMFSFQVDAREQAAAYEHRHMLRRARETLVPRLSAEGDLSEGLVRQWSDLLGYVDAEGAALLVEDEFSAIGRTPGEDQVRAIVAWLARTGADEAVFATASLSAQWEPARAFGGHASGVLVLTLSRDPSTHILWFRPELVETLRWAGNPAQALERRPDGGLSPRASFQTYTESVRLHAKPWTEVEIEAVRLLRLSLLEVAHARSGQVARERAAAASRHEMMLAELNHRVKNTLATVQALARHSRSSAVTLDSYVHSFEQRIQAMAASHNLLSDAAWRAIDLHTLIIEQLLPYAKVGDNLRLDGDRMTVLPRMGTSFGMVFHELATNAAKYGALSLPGGHVGIAWTITGAAPARLLRLVWREEGGPQVRPPARRGFGSFVTQRVIAYEMHGRSEVTYDPAGLRFFMEVPETALVLGPGPAGAAGTSGAPLAASPDVPRILLVEDDALIAHVLEQAVRALGWTPVGPVGRVEAAMVLAQIEAGQLQGAVLDINIDEAKVWPVAELLQNQGVPFLFATAYERSRKVLPERFAGVSVLSKPFVEQQLMDTLLWLVAGRRTERNGHTASEA